MLADSTHRSPQVPSDFVEPLHLHPTTIPSTNNLSPVPPKYDCEENYPQDDDSDTNSDNNDMNKLQHPLICLIQSTLPKQENEMPLQEDILSK